MKICGLRTAGDVRAAIDANADAIGFVFADSIRRVSPAAAAELVRSIPRHIEVIAVTRRPDQALVDEIAATLRPQRLQADADALDALHLPHGLQALPVLRTGMTRPAQLPELFLYEGATSGTGTLADWDEAAALAACGGLLLAGGLTPANVGAAVSRVRPFGVDVSSGVERLPGLKDPGLITEFIARARDTARTLPGADP